MENSPRALGALTPFRMFSGTAATAATAPAAAAAPAPSDPDPLEPPCSPGTWNEYLASRMEDIQAAVRSDSGPIFNQLQRGDYYLSPSGLLAKCVDAALAFARPDVSCSVSKFSPGLLQHVLVVVLIHCIGWGDPRAVIGLERPYFAERVAQ